MDKAREQVLHAHPSSRATTSSALDYTRAVVDEEKVVAFGAEELNQPHSSDKAHDEGDEPFAVLLDQNVPNQNVPVEVGLAGKSDTASRFMAP